jgi:DNA-binding MarR family transcriptional regulator
MHTYLTLMDELGPLACHCLVTRQIARHVSKLYERHLAPSGITATQLAILNFLERQQKMTMNELAAAMLMDRTTLLRALKPLRSKKLILSAPQAGEPRRLAIWLSRAGVRKISETRPLWEAAQGEYEAQIGFEYARRLRSDLLSTMGAS